MAKSKPTPRAPRLVVDVTQEEIANAMRSHSGRCMISEAIKRSNPEAAHVLTDLQGIRVTWPKRGIRAMYLTPAQAQVALYKFDEGMEVEPFSFKANAVRVVRSRAAAGVKAKNVKNVPNKAEVRIGDGGRGSGETGNLGNTTIVGGRLPKSAALGDNFKFGNRRKFGLRALAHVWEQSKA